MQTICKECIFADFSEGVQIGCHFMDRLNKYKEKGLASIDGPDKWYFTINTLCKACTKIKVGQSIPDDYVNIVYNSIKPKIDAIIYGDDNKIISILESIKNDGYNKIIACQPNMIGLKSYYDFSQIYPKIIVAGQIENRYELEYLDNACKKSTADYLVIINDLNVPSIPKIIEDYVMNQLIDFIGILPENDLNGLVISPRVFKFLGGNFEKSIIDKVKEINNYESMTFKWETLK